MAGTPDKTHPGRTGRDQVDVHFSGAVTYLPPSAAEKLFFRIEAQPD